MTHKFEKLKATRLESQKKMHDTVSEIIAAFHLPRVTSYEKLEEEVSKCRSVAAKPSDTCVHNMQRRHGLAKVGEVAR